MDAMPDAVLVYRGDGRALMVNPRAEEIFGYTGSELLGLTMEDLMPERFRRRHVQHRTAFQAHPSVRAMGAGLELYGLRQDGTEFPVEISLSPASIGGQAVVIAAVRDVTARKQLEDERTRALQQLETIQQVVTDGALTRLRLDELLPDLLARVRSALNADTAVILLVDEVGEALVARAALGLEEEVEDGLCVPLGAGFAGRIAEQRHAIAIDDIDAIETVNPMLKAKGIRSMLGVPLLVEDRLLGVLQVGSLRQKRFTAPEMRLLQLVADRAALALDRARLYEEAREAVRLRNEFLSSISHDLGNPVAAIRLEARRLLETVDVGGAGEGLEQIELTATRIWRQVEEILDLARLQVGRTLELSWRALDLVALAGELVAAQQAMTERHRLRLEYDGSELVGEWDGPRLERVLTNLLSNAVKYSPDGGEILVCLAREIEQEPARSWAVLSVRDSGIGIPAEELPRIVERFYRASNVRGRFPGTGIGLYGAQRIVELHGGELKIDSEEHRGTTVTIRLPLD